MDVRGGGAAAEDARIVKPGYESDDEADEKRWPGHHTSAAPMHLVRCCCTCTFPAQEPMGVLMSPAGRLH